MSSKKNGIIRYVPNLFRILLVLGVIAFISFLFPNNVKFKYEFERGQVWRYEDLRAPFAFPIRKPDAVFEAEKRAVLELVSPVYEWKRSVAIKQGMAFDSAFSNQLAALEGSEEFKDVVERPQRYREYGLSLLQRYYQAGIIQLSEEHADKSAQFVITVLDSSELREQTLANIRSQRTARETMQDELSNSRLAEPEFIFPLLEQHLQANLVYNDSVTQKLRQRSIESIPPSQGVVQQGELIISKGGIVTDAIYQQLLSYREQFQKEVSANQSYLGVFAGYSLLTALVVTVFVFYLRLFAPLVYSRFHKLVFVMMWLVLYSYLVFLVEDSQVLSAYLIPFCIVPIVVKTFFNERLALFTHIVNVLIASFLTSLGYEFTFLQLLAGIVVILSDVDTRDWTRYFNSLILIFLSYAAGYFGLSLIEEGSVNHIEWRDYIWLAFNVFLTLLAYPLIPLVERLFGFVSPITLMELSDMNRPLLRELAIRAPGTLQHSLQVANMAESAARRIGANPLLVKVGALYHDIGKTQNPGFFIENQSGRNPHESITELESAEMIIGHVKEGVQMAKKHRLPVVLIDFIRTHHGTTRVEYFYRNYLKKYPDHAVEERLFRYPGPRPTSKEESILMLADSIEAACRSLKNPTEEDLSRLIDNIISAKISSKQLEDSQLTFRELEACRATFQSLMKSVHHTRIAYPDEKELPKGASQLGDRPAPQESERLEEVSSETRTDSDDTHSDSNAPDVDEKQP